MMTRYKAENNLSLAHSTVTSGILICLLVSIPIVLIFFLFKNELSFVFSDERCVEIFTIIIPGLILTSVYAVFRGAFWGNKDFLTYSVIELLEEGVMLIAGVLLINRATSFTDGVVKAGWAVLLSYIFSFLMASMMFFAKKGKLKHPLNTLKPLVSSSAPITCMRTATSFVNSLIAIALPARLVASGLTNTQAISQFGEAFGMAIPILFMPSTLIGSLAVVLVPELSENYYKKQTKTLNNNVNKAIKFSILISSVIIPVLFSFGKSIGLFLYNSLNAGTYLARFSPIILPMSVCMITTSILNSLNLERKTLLNYLYGAIALILSIFLFPKHIGIYALYVGLLGQFLITAIANLITLRKKMKANVTYAGFIGKNLFITTLSIVFGYTLNVVLKRIFSDALVSILGSITLTCFTILLCIIFVNEINFLNKNNTYARNKKL